MANENAVVLKGFAPSDDPLWGSSPNSLHRQFYQFAGAVATRLFKDQLRKGIGRDGRRLLPVSPRSRPDGAKGPPLSPHQAESRTQKWLRTTVGFRAGTVTLWWSHGWGRIVGYHARGEVIGAPIRDVQGLSPASDRRFRDECRRWWLRRRPTPDQLHRWRKQSGDGRADHEGPTILPLRPVILPMVAKGR